MKKTLSFVLIMMLSVSLFGCVKAKNETQVKENTKQTEEANKKDITSLVENFGKKLQMFSLLADKEIVSKSMQENYGDFVAPELLAKWKSNPESAPGRTVSSPWPDRIEVQSIEKVSEGIYKVKGEIIEITSVEQKNGGVAAKRAITLEIKKIENRWLIDDVTLGTYEVIGPTIYTNTQYGFNFYLPDSWKGYTIVSDKWEGLSTEGQKNVAAGPIIYIRHPKWSSQNPRQDIPIMIFTIAQWNSLQKDEFHIGAAPIGPSKLGGNSKYIFALPARYNFAFLTGYEEVENILKNNPLQPIQ